MTTDRIMTDAEHAETALRIADFIVEEVHKHPKLWMEDRRKDVITYGPNAYHNQTKQGLFLEMYYGAPAKIWTPWGHIQFAGSSSYPGDYTFKDHITPVLIEALGLVTYIAEYESSMGVFGPYYFITKFEGVELPAPLPRFKSEYLDYHTVKDLWQAFIASR